MLMSMNSFGTGCCGTTGLQTDWYSDLGRYEQQIMWDGILYTLSPNFSEVDTQLSPMVLRPDFEEEYKDDFVKALKLYHLGQSDEVQKIINKYFEKDNRGPAATTSFKLLQELIIHDKPHIWKGLSPSHPLETLHIEDAIRHFVSCAQEWMFLASSGGSSGDEQNRMDELENFLTSALSEIKVWIPMPPSQGVEVPDMKV
jgi:hypothetical protein